MGKIIYIGILILFIIPISHFVFKGNWLWYWLADSVLLLLYMSGLFWFYNHIFISFNNSKMEVFKSNPYKELGLNYNEFNLNSTKGHTIKGWYIPSVKPKDSKPVIIYSHGFGLSREQLGEVSYRQFNYFLKKGYSVITFEYPIGDREKSHEITGGVIESEDLATVVRFAENKGYKNICLMGYSYGGNTSLYYAVNKVQPLVDAVILDSTFIVTPEIFAKQLQTWMGIPSHISQFFLRFTWKSKIGYSHKTHPIKNIFTANNDIPILIWHGTSDKDASYMVMQTIYSYQSHPLSQLKTVKEGNHIELHNIVGEYTYNQETCDWLEKVVSIK